MSAGEGPGKPARWADLAALLALAVAVALVYGRLLFTNLAPASGDLLTYFTPYWDYVNEALLAGRIPLWNPYLFAGAPLQANPQTQVFYPLRWLFLPLPAEKGLVWFAALHAWLTGAFAYALARRVFKVGVLAGLAAGLILALNGWMTGLLGQPVRWAAMPWLPAALLLWEVRPIGDDGWRSRRWRCWLAALGLVWALTLLAGHTQIFYNHAVLFAAWVAAPLLWQAGKDMRRAAAAAWRRAWALLWPAAVQVGLVFALALALAALQLLPSLEASALSYRGGGLSFSDHAALSLPPWRLGFALLPHYGRDLGQALGSDAFAEWVAYTGVIGLGLAALGLGYGSRRRRALALALTVCGAALALGAYNPISYVLYTLAPGWGLFRVPARWLEAAVLGVALLAALGAERLLAGAGLRLPAGRTPRLLAAAGLVAAVIVAALSRPNPLTLAAWAAALLALAVLWRNRRRWPRLALAAALALLLAELYAASFTLPVQHPTAPQAIRSWRTAPARIAAEDRPLCRTLSLSATTYDPGDLADLRLIYGPFLDDWALHDLEAATKAKEVLAPNLGLLLRLPSLDGFGGGVLPTRRFAEAMRLFLPGQRLVADGRLREQLREIPDARLLSLFNVCHVIADKDFDLWHEDVYYDLAFGEVLSAAQPELEIAGLPAFPVTHLGLVSHLVGSAHVAQGETVAELEIVYAGGERLLLPLQAGVHTAAGADDAVGLAHRRDLPHVRWRYHAAGQDAIARFALAGAAAMRRVELVRVRLLHLDASLFVRGLALIDAASGAHATPPVSRHLWQRIHSGDVKIYRNGAVMARAFMAAEAGLSADDQATLALMQDPGFDPARTVWLAEGEPLTGGRGTAEVVDWAPEMLHVRVQADSAGMLVVSEAWYPGWQAQVDGAAAPLYRANLLLRALPVPAGDHDVILRFRPPRFYAGAAISLLAVLFLLLLWFWPGSRRRGGRD